MQPQNNYQQTLFQEIFRWSRGCGCRMHHVSQWGKTIIQSRKHYFNTLQGFTAVLPVQECQSQCYHLTFLWFTAVNLNQVTRNQKGLIGWLNKLLTYSAMKNILFHINFESALVQLCLIELQQHVSHTHNVHWQCRVLYWHMAKKSWESNHQTSLPPELQPCHHL